MKKVVTRYRLEFYLFDLFDLFYLFDTNLELAVSILANGRVILNFKKSVLVCKTFSIFFIV